MTLRERIIAAFRGEMPDWVPWTVYRGIGLEREVEEKLCAMGMGHIVIARPYATGTPNVRVEEEQTERDGTTFTTRRYVTPVGELSQVLQTEPGYGSSRSIEYPVKGPDDYRVLEFMIRDTTVTPKHEAFVAAEQELGDAGVAIAAIERVPIQRLWIQFTGLERMGYDLYDHPTRVESVFDAMREKDRETWQIVADSAAEFLWCPDNISGEVTGPPLFRRYCKPHYDELAAVMHPKGKRLVVHMDGMMRRLVDCVAETEIDIVEAFTPPPDADLPLDEALSAWPGKVLSLNFPSSIHIASPETIRNVTLELLQQAAPGRRFVLGVTENIPADAVERSLTTITETVAEHGRCPIESSSFPDR